MLKSLVLHKEMSTYMMIQTKLSDDILGKGLGFLTSLRIHTSQKTFPVGAFHSLRQVASSLMLTLDWTLTKRSGDTVQPFMFFSVVVGKLHARQSSRISTPFELDLSSPKYLED